MKPSPDQFERVQKLLALKRYEVPPPGYFRTLSSNVIARLERSMIEEVPWWQRLGFDFDLRPAYLCGLSVMVCGLLSAGIIVASTPEKWTNELAEFELNPFGQTGVVLASPRILSAPQRVPASTEAILNTDSSPFEQFKIRATPVNFSLTR